MTAPSLVMSRGTRRFTMRDAIPILVSRGSHPPAWANLLVFGLAALGAEWVVHQGAALLALLQMTIYVIQENLEMLSVNAGLPGLGVLAARQHATVVPLHILLAFITSLLLWTVASWLGVLHAAVAAAEALHRWTHRWDALPQAPTADGAAIVRCYLAAA